MTHFTIKPFYISYEKHSPELEEVVNNAIGVFEVMGGVRIPRRNIKSNHWFNGDFGSLDWYLEKALDRERNQARTDILWELFNREPFQSTEPHHELIILERDLFSSGTHFVFGETRPKISNNGIIFSDFSNDGRNRFVSGSIQSSYRMRENYGHNWKESFFSILVHEIGHFYGLPTTKNPNFLDEKDPRCKGFLDMRHCNDRYCIMEQVNIDGRLDLLEKTRFVLKNNYRLFCEYDASALKENLGRMYS